MTDFKETIKNNPKTPKNDIELIVSKDSNESHKTQSQI